MLTLLLAASLAQADISPPRALQRGPCDGEKDGAVCRTADGHAGTCMRSPPPAPDQASHAGSVGIGWLWSQCVPNDPVARARMLQREAPDAPEEVAPPEPPPAAAKPEPPSGCGCATTSPPGAPLAALAAWLLRRRRAGAHGMT